MCVHTAETQGEGDHARRGRRAREHSWASGAALPQGDFQSALRLQPPSFRLLPSLPNTHVFHTDSILHAQQVGYQTVWSEKG